MKNLVELGLENKVFTYEDVAELIFGKLTVKVDNIDLQAQTGTKIITWEMRNCEVFSKDLRHYILQIMRGDLHNPNYDFVLQRILCALGYQCVSKEPGHDVNHTLISWTTIFTTTTPNAKNARTLPLREILFWHDCEMPYTFDEISLIQRIVSERVKEHQFAAWFEDPASGQHRREAVELGLKLSCDEYTSGNLYYIGKLLEFLIAIDYAPEPVG